MCFTSYANLCASLQSPLKLVQHSVSHIFHECKKLWSKKVISEVILTVNLTSCAMLCSVSHKVQIPTLLGFFAKLRKATISFIMFVHLSVCPPIRMEQFGSHWMDFDEI